MQCNNFIRIVGIIILSVAIVDIMIYHFTVPVSDAIFMFNKSMFSQYMFLLSTIKNLFLFSKNVIIFLWEDALLNLIKQCIIYNNLVYRNERHFKYKESIPNFNFVFISKLFLLDIYSVVTFSQSVFKVLCYDLFNICL